MYCPPPVIFQPHLFYRQLDFSCLSLAGLQFLKPLLINCTKVLILILLDIKIKSILCLLSRKLEFLLCRTNSGNYTRLSAFFFTSKFKSLRCDWTHENLPFIFDPVYTKIIFFYSSRWRYEKTGNLKFEKFIEKYEGEANGQVLIFLLFISMYNFLKL